MKRFLLAVLALALCAAAPAHALDPLSLLVLRMLRDQLITAELESALAAPAKADSLPDDSRYPGDLRAIVEQGFPHLEAAQREAVYEGLRDVMRDPRHAAERDAILNEFLAAASASRNAHRALAGLSERQKRAIAMEAAAAYRGRDEAEVREAIALLRSPATPLPRDLRELMLAEFAAVADRTTSR